MRLMLDEYFFAFFLIVFVTIVFPNVVLHPTIVFGYGGGSNGGSGSGSSGSSDSGSIPNNENVIVPLSTNKSITAFEIPEQVGATIIDTSNFVIRITMPYGTDVTILAPIISFQGGNISPASGEVLDFTRARSYTVTAADASTRIYSVIVDLAPRKPVEDPLSEWFVEEVKGTDMVRDGEIDILDFNTLMVHWNDTSEDNPADVNGDESVDVFDFNLLMVYWGATE